MAERPWPELLEQRAVHQLQPFGDRQDLGDPPRDFGGAVIRDLGGRGFDRGGVGDDAEQAGARLVVQLGGDLAPLLLLDRDQLPIEPPVFLARRVKRAGEHIEAVGDRRKFLDLGLLEPRRVVAALEIVHAARQVRERIEKPAKHDIENCENGAVQPEP